MFTGKAIAGFFLRLALIYTLSIMAWLAIGGAYGAVFRTTAEFLFGSFGRHGFVRFEPLAMASGDMDTAVLLRNQETRADGRDVISSRRLGYIPTAFLTALVLATPIPFQRRWRALLWGLALIHVYVATRVLLILLWDFNGSHAWALYTPGPFGSALLSGLALLFGAALSGCYIGPIFIWIITTFRTSDWPASQA
jgi:hypothetical protein